METTYHNKKRESIWFSAKAYPFKLPVSTLTPEYQGRFYTLFSQTSRFKYLLRIIEYKSCEKPACVQYRLPI